MGRNFYNDDDDFIVQGEDGRYYNYENGQEVDERGNVIAEPGRIARGRYSATSDELEEYIIRDQEPERPDSESIYNTDLSGTGTKPRVRAEIRNFFDYCEQMVEQGEVAEIASEYIGQFLSLHMISQMSPMRDDWDRYDTLLGDTDMNDRYKEAMKAFFEDPEKRKAAFNRFLDYEMDALKEMGTNAEKDKESPLQSRGGFAVLLVEDMIKSCGEEIQAEYHEALNGRLDKLGTEKEKRSMKDAISLLTRNRYPSEWPSYYKDYESQMNYDDLVWKEVEKVVGEKSDRFINLDMLYFRRNDLNDMLRETLFDKKFHDFFCAQEEKLLKEEKQVRDNQYSQYKKDAKLICDSAEESERSKKTETFKKAKEQYNSFLEDEWDLEAPKREEWIEICEAYFKEQHDLATKIREARQEKELGSLMENQLKKDYNLLSAEELKAHEENVQKLLGVDAPEAAENLNYLFEKQAEIKAELGRMYGKERESAQEGAEWKLLNSGTQIRINSLEHLVRSSGQDSGLLDAMEETGELHYRERTGNGKADGKETAQAGTEETDKTRNLEEYRKLHQRAENGQVHPLTDEKARYAEQVKGVQEAVGKDLIPDDSQKSYELKERFSRETVKDLISKLDQTQKNGENSKKYTDMMNSLREFSEKGTNLETAISQCQNYISARGRMWGPVSQVGKDRLALAKDAMKTFDLLREEKANIKEVPGKAQEQQEKAVSAAGRVAKIGFQELQKEEGHTQERRSTIQRESLNKESHKQMSGPFFS